MTDANAFADLGLQFVDPYNEHVGLKALKPQNEARIFSIITSIPGMPSTFIKFYQHYFDQLRKKVRCTGQNCCLKAYEVKTMLDALPEQERKGKSDGKRQLRYIFPVVVYQGSDARSYGGPVEIRYMDLPGTSFNQLQNAASTVNEEIAPLFERDFMLTRDPSKTMPVPVINHLECRAKWLTDPVLNAEVQKQLEDFVPKLLEVIPKRYTEEEFNKMWEEAKSAQSIAQTVAAQAPIVNTPNIISPVQPIPAPAQVQPIQVAPVQPVQAANPVPATIPTPSAQFTPQNLINGGFTLPTVQNTVTPVQNIVTPESLVATPAVNPAPVVNPAPEAAPQIQVPPVQAETTAPASTPVMAQTEINLDSIGDLTSIINNLPKTEG